VSIEIISKLISLAALQQLLIMFFSLQKYHPYLILLQALYDYLQENDYTATMYFIGSNVIDWPFQAQRGVEDGHEVRL
jgi:hypothetical protein